MSNRLFQGVVHQMREAIDRTIGVIDETMSVIACSDLGRIGEVSDSVTAESFSLQEAFVKDGYTYKPFGSRPRAENILFVEGTDEEAASLPRCWRFRSRASNSITTKNMTVATLSKTLSLTISCLGISISRRVSCVSTMMSAARCC